ncbi:MAG: type I secretion C-terminal target domain-containing protein [Betaproteobacteria bacterium]|nr:type I secretion C-terminal target domain-containing protein [Betaproteobacteria bacterium]
MSGGDGDDHIDGRGGNDVLVGGQGNDTLTGGTGSDRFDYNNINEGTDTITDFTRGAGGDVLDIKDVLSGYVPGFSNLSDFVQLVEGGGNTMVNVNADGIGSDFVSLATLEGVTGALLNDLLAQGNLIVS